MLQGLIQFFNFFNIIFIGTGLSVIAVSYFIYKPFNEEEYESDTNEDDYYEFKYLDEYYELLDRKNNNFDNIENYEEDFKDDISNDTDSEDIILQNNIEELDKLSDVETMEEKNEREKKELDDKLESIKEKFIKEETPRGLIYMCYDKDNNNFIYYCKSKDIPFKYLDTVGRKFIIENNCPEIYIDYEQEYKNAINKKYMDFIENKKKMEEQINQQKKDQEEKNKKNVFAVFKNYNKNDTSEKNFNNIILTEKCNIYKYKGTLYDYENYIKSKEINTIDFINIDFKTFKELEKKEKKEK